LDVGARIFFGEGALEAEVLSRDPGGTRVLQFRAHGGEDVPALLHRLGEAPLPPYIHAPLADRERYQTVYARLEGSAAAPTAGLRQLRPGAGRTRLYITPGFEFRIVDALITNFHMPRSSLLILVSAFAGLEPVRAAYHAALAAGYRFLSFGDAMLIV